jgi:hypothetical protein
MKVVGIGDSANLKGANLVVAGLHEMNLDKLYKL